MGVFQYLELVSIDVKLMIAMVPARWVCAMPCFESASRRRSAFLGAYCMRGMGRSFCEDPLL